MIKKLLGICFSAILITSISGCLEKNTVDRSTNKVQQTLNQKASSDEEEVANVSNKEESTPVSNEKLTDYPTQKDKIQLKGKINNKLDIHMELQITNKDHFDDIGEMYWNPTATMNHEQPAILYEGSYYYDQYIKKIKIVAEAYPNGYFTIYEFDENNEYSGSFGGFFESGNILNGMWNNDKGNTYPFYLVESTSKIDELNLNVDNKIGDYYTIGSHKDNLTHLYIVSTSDEKFKFHITAYSKPNTGNVGGIAYYTDESKKEATFYDERNDIKINFIFDDKTIKVSIIGDYDMKYAGAHVTLDGTFEKSESKINLDE